MPAKDIYHDTVRKALIKDGWTITHDPFPLTVGDKHVYIDFGAERTLAAQKGDQKIAVETKSFTGASDVRDFEQALGQYILYRSHLNNIEPDRKLFLAVPQKVHITTFDEPMTRPILEEERVAVMVFDPKKEVILKWIP